MRALIGIIFVAYTIAFALRAGDWRFRGIFEGKRLSDINFLLSWRYLICVLIGFFLAVPVVHLIFPDTHWRGQVWLGTGLALLAGLLVGAAWQKVSGKSLPDFQREVIRWTGGYSLVAFLAAVFIWLPDLQQEQFPFDRLNAIQCLSEGDISQTNIALGGARDISITEPGKIESFKNFLADAKISERYKKANVNKEVQIEIRSGGDSYVYDAFVPADRPDDIMLKFSEKGTEIAIRLPGLKHWLDENVLNKKE